MNRPFTATAAVSARMQELGLTVADLADRAKVNYTTVLYFGMLSHDRQTLERLSVTLDWPSDHLWKLWDGERLD